MSKTQRDEAPGAEAENSTPFGAGSFIGAFRSFRPEIELALHEGPAGRRFLVDRRELVSIELPLRDARPSCRTATDLLLERDGSGSIAGRREDAPDSIDGSVTFFESIRALGRRLRAYAGLPARLLVGAFRGVTEMEMEATSIGSSVEEYARGPREHVRRPLDSPYYADQLSLYQDQLSLSRARSAFAQLATPTADELLESLRAFSESLKAEPNPEEIRRAEEANERSRRFLCSVLTEDEVSCLDKIGVVPVIGEATGDLWLVGRKGSYNMVRYESQEDGSAAEARLYCVSSGSFFGEPIDDLVASIVLMLRGNERELIGLANSIIIGYPTEAFCRKYYPESTEEVKRLNQAIEDLHGKFYSLARSRCHDKEAMDCVVATLEGSISMRN